MTLIKAEFPDKLQCLFKPSRYKILYGGRGGAKSWGVARALLILGAKKQMRFLCARELQNSIRDSVHQLLSDQIKELGLEDFYEIQSSVIYGKNGTQFSFEGLRHNITKVKSYEGVDIAWVEEAQTVSKSSWDTLIPTIRKDGSEIWVTFNPELEEDETYKRFIVHPPHESIIEKINWRDNPWFPEVLRKEMEDLKAKDTDSYLNIWEGNCRVTLDGAVYAKELREATESGRIGKIAYDPTKQVHTFWDLGWSDMVSIWFAQSVGLEYRIIDFMQDRQRTVNHYVSELQKKPYVYGTDYLPHDANAKQLAAGGKSIKMLMDGLGRKTTVLPRMSIEHGINATRTMFSNFWIDEKNCADGLQAIRRYRYDVDPDTGQFSKKPLHDENSHAADALRALAVSLTEKKETQKKSSQRYQGRDAWAA